jgi:hypothetical protein
MINANQKKGLLSKMGATEYPRRVVKPAILKPSQRATGPVASPPNQNKGGCGSCRRGAGKRK